MMRTLRVELKADPLWYINPVWLSWPARVQAFRDSFAGYAYQQVGTPCIGGGWRAVVYMQSPDSVTESQLDSLRRNWSTRTGGVDVESVHIVPGIGNCDADKAALEKKTVSGRITDRIGQLAGDTGRAVLIAAVVVAVAYFALNAKGTKEWS